MKKILQKGEKILEQKAQKVEDFLSIQGLIKELRESLNGEGAALAAPQIGKSLRIFIVSEKVFKEDEEKNLVYINPEIIKKSKEREWKEEGCLSVTGYVGEVNRAIKCTIKAYDENGKEFTRGASDFLSQVFQHEIDHLDGILFTEKARNLKKIEDEE